MEIICEWQKVCQLAGGGRGSYYTVTTCLGDYNVHIDDSRRYEK